MAGLLTSVHKYLCSFFSVFVMADWSNTTLTPFPLACPYKIPRSLKLPHVAWQVLCLVKQPGQYISWLYFPEEPKHSGVVQTSNPHRDTTCTESLYCLCIRDFTTCHLTYSCAHSMCLSWFHWDRSRGQPWSAGRQQFRAADPSWITGRS